MIDINAPTPGFYRRRLVKGGPYVPASIMWVDGERGADGELLSDQRLVCIVAGAERDAYDEWTWLAANPISEDEYIVMVAQAEWARGTTAPEATPARRIDYMISPAIF